MSKKKKTVAEEEPKTAEERVDYVFEFSLSRETSEQFEQLSKEIKTPLGVLFKFFIMRGIRAFLLAKKTVFNAAKPMKAAKVKAAQLPAPETLVVVDLAKLPPGFAEYLSLHAEKRGVPISQHILNILEACFSAAEIRPAKKGKGKK